MCTGTYALAFDVLLHACVARVVCLTRWRAAVRPRRGDERAAQERGQAGGGTETREPQSPTQEVLSVSRAAAGRRARIKFIF